MNNDARVAEIARRLAAAMQKRAVSRQPDDLKVVQAIQTELVSAVREENIDLE